MELEKMILSEVAQIQKDKCGIFSLLCRSLFQILRWEGFPAQAKAGLGERENGATDDWNCHFLRQKRGV